MGSNFATDMAEEVSFGNVSLQRAIENHLRYNHYPPVSLDFVPVCLKAIKIAQECEDSQEYGRMDANIKMPNGIKKSVYDIIEGLHLGFFIEFVE